jgi:hypothetical protein|tara:strand:+ start:320 stop:922 length:603 start_codon:yes stop_codon:yes gene_type:complete
MNIGNIVSSSKINEDNFKLFEEIESVDNSLPTLIVGWDKTKKMFGDKVSILNKQISDNLYWTFSTTERRVDYDDDIITFKQECYNNFGSELSYVYIDPIHDKPKKIKKILKKIYSLSESISYFTDKNMLYILGENIVFGINLEVTEFIGVSTNSIITRVVNLRNSVLIDNEIFNKCKEFIKKLDNNYKLVPYVVKYGKYY